MSRKGGSQRMGEPQARIARILQPIRDEDYAGPQFTTDRGTLAHNPAVADIETVPNALSAAECERIMQSAHALQSSGGRIPRHDDTRWIYERVAGVFERANRKFRFRVVGIIEEIVIGAYSATGNPPWQVDCAHNFTANRKLSLSLPLSGGTDGAGLEFAGRELAPIAAGTAVVYPSFLAHRVNPLGGEARAALVAFAYGPTFE